MRKKTYTDYNQYIEHQSKKNDLNAVIDFHTKNWDKITKNFEIRFKRLNFVKDTENKSDKKTLCVGARAGQEVQGLINCGYQSIGIDVNPMKGYEHLVKKGDAHHTNFEDNTFDVIYTNVIDHIYNLPLFIKECNRILKNDGYMIFDFCVTGEGFGEYDIVSLSQASELTDMFPSSWSIVLNDEEKWLRKNIEKSLMYNVVIQKNENK